MSYPTKPVNLNGWTDWVTPIMQGYKMACCDCGLVHNVEFRVVRVKRHCKDGGCIVEDLPTNKYKVQVRMNRNERSTGQLRRRRVRHGK